MLFNTKNNSLANVLGDILKEYANANIQNSNIQNRNVENRNIQENEEASMKEPDINEQSKPDNRKQDNPTQPLGVMDSIAQELTSVRLQQAIILSEIVGKPRSKTRKRRRF